MTNVWVSDDANALPSGANAGDYLVRRDGADVALGRASDAGGIEWFATVPVSSFPDEARAALDAAGSAAAEPGTQPALLTAVKGIETAVRDRGG